VPGKIIAVCYIDEQTNILHYMLFTVFVKVAVKHFVEVNLGRGLQVAGVYWQLAPCYEIT